MLLGTCAYLLTHTVASETTREKTASERGTQAQGGLRERQPRQEPESSLSSHSEPNRTITVEEREVEVERECKAQEEAVVSNGTLTVEEREVDVAEDERDHNTPEAAVVGNGTVDNETVNVDTTPVSSTKVR